MELRICLSLKILEKHSVISHHNDSVIKVSVMFSRLFTRAAVCDNFRTVFFKAS